MDKCRHQFTEEEVAELKKYRDKQKDKRLALRFVALLMLAENDGADKVAEVIGKSVRTIENWLKQYVEKGIDSLNSFQYVNKKSYLTPEQIKQTADWVRETNPASLKEVAAYIRENFNVKYKLESVTRSSSFLLRYIAYIGLGSSPRLGSGFVFTRSTNTIHAGKPTELSLNQMKGLCHMSVKILPKSAVTPGQKIICMQRYGRNVSMRDEILIQNCMRAPYVHIRALAVCEKLHRRTRCSDKAV